MKEIKTILFPTDFSDYSNLAKKCAFSFARQYDAKIVAIHAIELVADFAHIYTPQLTTDEVVEIMWRDAEARMQDLFSEDEKKEVAIETIVKQGKAYLEIIETAKEKNADLIVISTHGRTGYDRDRHGSVAEMVIRKAPCSVYVAKK